jgi:drug/metabolite transporter (DMT)-like permease
MEDNLIPKNIDAKQKSLMSPYTLGSLSLILTTILWGSTFTITNQVTQIIPPLLYMGIRYLLGFIVFLPMWNRLKVMDLQKWKITLIASLLLWSSFVLQTIGIQLTTAAKSAFITGFNVILVPLFTAGIYRQRVKPIIWVSTVIALIGISLMSFAGFSSIELGDVLVLISGVLYAFYIIYIERVVDKIDLVPFSAFQLGFLSIFSFFTSFIFEDMVSFISQNRATLFSRDIILIMVYMGVIATSIATIAQMYGQYHVSATRAAIIYALEPIFGALFAVFIGREILSWQTIVGGILVVGGILISIERSPQKDKIDFA